MEPHEKKLLEYAHFAAHLAREAGKVTLKYYRSMLQIERKSDQSPVTVADRETERYLVETIRSVYPDHGILGEELGEVNPDAPWRWVLDPIDGTQAFIHGVPLYTVLVALMHENEPLIGVIYNPPQDELVAAAKGLGCNYNGQPCHVSHVDQLSRARVHSTDWSSLAAHRPRFTRALLDTIHFGRTWADGYGYMLVATGRADAMLDPVLNPWDIAPLIPIITEAGGRFTTMEGAPADENGLADNGIASNGLIHDQILELSGFDTVHPVEE
ncbi:inositol monophosphatase family protein [bacterium]|nr:inositol monophosphatase family protein [bacterium]